mmetsp:Transcript_42300/g.76695  ORF Transcript_42300/g.76695 Transcript_42300/m.76695 type:complete len:760 (-) Transcript_42300:19-2298(-)
MALTGDNHGLNGAKNGKSTTMDPQTTEMEMKELQSQVESMKAMKAKFKEQEADFVQHSHQLQYREPALVREKQALDSENRELKLRDEQTRAEHELLEEQLAQAKQQLDDAGERSKTLMDLLVNLLSTNWVEKQFMTEELVRTTEHHMSRVESRAQVAQDQLADVRKCNRLAALNLSQEQRRTKELHDKMCQRQLELYKHRQSGFFASEDGAVLGTLPPSLLHPDISRQCHNADDMEAHITSLDVKPHDGSSKWISSLRCVDERCADIQEPEGEEEIDEQSGSAKTSSLLAPHRGMANSAADVSTFDSEQSVSSIRADDSGDGDDLLRAAGPDALLGSIGVKSTGSQAGPPPAPPPSPSPPDNRQLPKKQNAEQPPSPIVQQPLGPSSDERASQKAAAQRMEEQMSKILDSLDFAHEVVRLQQGVYEFGKLRAYVKLGSDNMVCVSTTQDATDSEPLDSFIRRRFGAGKKLEETPPSSPPPQQKIPMDARRTATPPPVHIQSEPRALTASPVVAPPEPALGAPCIAPPPAPGASHRSSSRVPAECQASMTPGSSLGGGGGSVGLSIRNAGSGNYGSGNYGSGSYGAATSSCSDASGGHNHHPIVGRHSPIRGSTNAALVQAQISTSRSATPRGPGHAPGPAFQPRQVAKVPPSSARSLPRGSSIVRQVIVPVPLNGSSPHPRAASTSPVRPLRAVKPGIPTVSAAGVINGTSRASWGSRSTGRASPSQRVSSTSPVRMVATARLNGAAVPTATPAQVWRS